MKNLIYITAIGFMLISLVTCYSTKTLTNFEEYAQCLKKKHGKYVVNKNVKVLSITTKEKDTLFFGKKYPCRITEHYIVGMPLVILPDSIKFDSINYERNSLNTMWKEGIKYSFIKFKESSLLCVKMDTLRIPLGEIEELKIKKSRKVATSLLVVGTTGTVAFVIAFAIALNQLANVF